MFAVADIKLLLTRYNDTGNDSEPRRPPWTWSALDEAERGALARMIDVWAETYNHVHALELEEIVPPCWRLHAALGWELGVQVWAWYAVHLDTKASALMATDYYGRHLPGFQKRIPRLLGSSPKECQKGKHYPKWRKADVEAAASAYSQNTTDNGGTAEEDTLSGLTFAFHHMSR